MPNLSRPFIERPKATVLLVAGFFLLGVMAYFQLQISSLPDVDFPTINVWATMPGASSENMASSIAGPLERALSNVPNVTSMTSSSSLSQTDITLQFSLERNIDAAAQDVQAAINSASGLPKDLPSPPSYEKVNPSAFSIISLAATSDTMPLPEVYDYVDNVIARALSQFPGVGVVDYHGDQVPAIRVQVNPTALAAHGLDLEDVRVALAGSTVDRPKGTLDSEKKTLLIAANDQLLKAQPYNDQIIAWRNGSPVRVRDIGQAIDATEESKTGAWAQQSKAIINISLMGLTIAVGFVVDDAIVVMENVMRHAEMGKPRLQAAIDGAGEVGFTLLSMTLSLIAAFLPLLLMGGVIGRLFREFSVVVCVAIILSGAISITQTAVACRLFLSRNKDAPTRPSYRAIEAGEKWLLSFYRTGLSWVLRHKRWGLIATIGMFLGSVYLFIIIPKGFVPEQDNGLISASTEAAPDISFAEMTRKNQQLAEIVGQDADVANVYSYVETHPATNNGRLMINLKSFDQRKVTAREIIARLRPKLKTVPGIRVFMKPVQEIQIGGGGKTQYQYVVQGSDVTQLYKWVQIYEEKLQSLPQLEDVASDLNPSAPSVTVVVDRDKAARYGILPDSVDQIEGQEVRVGDVLIQIDPRPYQAALDQAVAKQNQDQAQLGYAQKVLDRDTGLFSKKILDQQSLDLQQATTAQLEALVKADEAAVSNAKVQLEFTKITSPIDGRVGLRLVDQGNIVHANDQTGLVMITQIQPLSVVFTLPESNLREITNRVAPGAGYDTFKVAAMDRENDQILDQGELGAVDNQIDETTGTIKLKAVFKNQELKLWPGQFVNVRLLIDTRRQGLVLPSTAINQGPNGDFVYVIRPDLTAEVRPVKVGGTEEGLTLIEHGVAEGENAVVDGQYLLRSNAHVRLKNAE